MKISKLFIALPFVICFNQAIASEQNSYVKFTAGVASKKPDFDTGLSSVDSDLNSSDTVGIFSIAYGYNFYKEHALPLRAEVQFQHDGNIDSSTYKIDSKLKANYLMFNGYYDFLNESSFTPFVTAGLGISFNKYEASGSYKSYTFDASETNTGVAVKLGVGSQYSFNDDFSAELGVNYLHNKAWSDVKTNSTEFAAGFIYKF